MKKLINKINNSKLLFTIFILVFFIIFDFLTNGIGIWSGLVGKLIILFENIYNHTYFGEQFVIEVICFIVIIPIILIFKNKYIFTQKRDNIFKSLLIAWPIIIYSIITLINSMIETNISNINGYELVALILLTFTIGLFEEIMCRGWIQNEFIERFGKDRKGVIFSIIISGIIFGIIHITNIFYGQDLSTTLMQILTATISGAAYGAIYYKTKNIWSVVILHGLWDFSLFFANINAATTCVTINSTIDGILPNLNILYLLMIIIISIPEIGLSFILLGKNSINEELDKKYKVKITNEEIKKEKETNLIFQIIMIIFLSICGLFTLISIIIGNPKSDSCPTYIEKNAMNYTEMIYNYSDYDLHINNKEISYKYNFKIDNNYNLILTNMTNNKEYIFEYKNILSIAMFENNDTYNVLFLKAQDNGDIIAYYSNFITKNNINNSDEFINSFINSFTQVMLPPLAGSLGYYKEKGNNYKYPLFISATNDRYILNQDGTIYKLKF